MGQRTRAAVQVAPVHTILQMYCVYRLPGKIMKTLLASGAPQLDPTSDFGKKQFVSY